MRRRGAWTPLLVFGTRLLLCALTLPALGQSGPRITLWRAVDGLPQSSVIGVSLDNQGNLITAHGFAVPAARFDGFQFTTLSNTVGAPTRVYVSRSEQMWSVDRTGLLEQTGEGWNLRALPEITSEYRTNLVRALRPLPARPIPLLPLDRDRVLVLLPDRLMEFDAGSHAVRTILPVSRTGLRKFNEMTPAHEDGAWIAGSGGLIRIPGPIRQVRSDTTFEEHTLPAHLSVSELQRPYEGRSGEVVLAGEDGNSGQKAILRWAEGRWDVWAVEAPTVHQAWAGPDGEFWGLTAGSVLRFDLEGSELRARIVMQAGRIADLLVERDGVAWLATSDGLVRIAPLPWRPAPNFPADAGAVTAVTSDRRGQVVALTSRAVYRLKGVGWTATALPGPLLDETTQRDRSLYPAPDGKLLVRTAEGNVLLDPDGLRHAIPEEFAQAVPFGSLADGRVLLRRGAETESQLLAFDGATFASFGTLPAETGALGNPTFALQTRSGELWVGYPEALLVRRGDLWTSFLDSESGATDGAFSAVELPDARVLVGGEEGVREFDGRRWRVLRRGLERVHAFQLARDGVLWVASGSGLHRWKDNSWFTLAEDEGLTSAAVFSVLEDGSGRLWAGTGRGLSVFDPKADVDPPRAVIAGADLPERAGDTRALFTIGGDDRWRFTPAGRLLFSWKLDNNLFSGWRPAASIQLTNLTAGTHRFSVRAMDPSGNTELSPATFEFSVSLPWFKDPRLVWTSAALAVLLAALGAQALLSYRRLSRSYVEVERQVAERSVALEKANAELLHSHKMRALGTLAAGVAHDFNNLLSIIKGSAQLLESQLDDGEKARQRLQRIKTAVDQGAGLVRAMLGYSRGASAPRKELDLVDAVQRAVRLLDESLQARIRLNASPRLGARVFAPPEMLQQIVLNLVQNADEATEQRGVITIEVAPALPPDDCVLKPAPAAAFFVVLVHDNGIGIAEENLGRIFEPFFTTKGFSSRRGTGLGLSMVYEFAKELGAGIAVQSTVGQGTTFRIYLPALRHFSTSAESAPARSSEAASTQPQE